ncbi:hypothetical protein [Methylocystis bryophila]|uniref:Uncharacterized protein n=1 Tax=Methylocystis bryophila TaxID=655015 RepID=A0A1W6MQC3_9HYPH|nr:hypothetical protein [Methylocystis bryophila]ARN79800.1 hypothetical protein B1812_00535 [Methylocystis bryophila]BDV39683.1 hypothetical protein DSM21852_29360 [Methylocystis bryophila]
MLVLAAALPMLCGPAEAGFFEDIFGGAEMQSASPRHWGRPRAHHARRMATPTPAKLVSVSEGARPKGGQFCPLANNSSKTIDSTQALMRDATLRYGDVVVTDEGVRVFEGRGACPHAISDFRTLAETRDLSRGTRTVLAAIERDIKTKNLGHVGRPIVAADPSSRAAR